MRGKKGYFRNFFILLRRNFICTLFPLGLEIGIVLCTFYVCDECFEKIKLLFSEPIFGSKSGEVQKYHY